MKKIFFIALTMVLSFNLFGEKASQENTLTGSFKAIARKALAHQMIEAGKTTKEVITTVYSDVKGLSEEIAKMPEFQELMDSATDAAYDVYDYAASRATDFLKDNFEQPVGTIANNLGTIVNSVDAIIDVFGNYTEKSKK